MAPRKPIAELISELRSWLPNYDHGPDDYPTILYRILATAPGGDELEDMGYEPIGNLGWHELDQLGRVLVAIQDKRDVEDLIRGLISEEEEEEVNEPRRMRSPARIREHGGEVSNIFWRDIPSDAKVELVGQKGSQSYIATLPSGKRMSVYWGGNDARDAQRSLDQRIRYQQQQQKSDQEIERKLRRPAPARRHTRRVSRRR